MENLNLDIDSYSLKDLVNLFSLEKHYSRHAVQEGKDKLHRQLQNVGSLGSEKKREIGMFIDSAASKLANLKGKPDENEGTWSQEFTNLVTSGTHYVIENPNLAAGKKSQYSEGRIAGEESFPAGYLNPINVNTTITGMNIDSRFRDDYYSTRSSNYVLHLPQRQKKVVSLRIATTEIPVSWYAVSRRRGDANFVIRDASASITSQTTIPGPPPLPGLIPAIDYSDITNISEASDTELPPGKYYNAWLVTLPDGNYEMDFQKESNAEDIRTAINKAISLAKPGYMSEETGIFYGHASGNYLNPAKDICFDVLRVSGRSSFAIPHWPDAPAPLGVNQLGESRFKDTGYVIEFAVSENGYLSLAENIQLRLGWQLGFRLGRYEAFSMLSEGICMLCGPRYIFVAIEDGQKNTGNSFIAAYSQSSLDKNIMTRINAANIMDDVGVFKSASDPGLSNQLNRTREYFGPVNIDRLHISLLDEYGRELELNNMDWSMTLVFEHLYD